MNVLASYIQGCSGAVVEHLVHNLKAGGSRLPVVQLLFCYTAGKFRWRIKLNRKFRPTWQKLFLLYVRNESAAPVCVAENHVKPCNSASTLVESRIFLSTEKTIEYRFRPYCRDTHWYCTHHRLVYLQEENI